ncbi:hypothetical protein [Zavarzinia sp. CC-PAN008]|uniref:hypothetical protein n=1 Tax=Zavarzinia sp. CC-PAN008 TaxID=3243332 RepID=UPI003F745B17
MAVATVGAGASTGLIHSQTKGNPDGSSPTTYVSPEDAARQQQEQAAVQAGAAARPDPIDAYDPNRSAYSQPSYSPSQAYGQGQAAYGQGQSAYGQGQAVYDQGQAAYDAPRDTVGDPLPLRPQGGGIEVEPLD